MSKNSAYSYQQIIAKVVRLRLAGRVTKQDCKSRPEAYDLQVSNRPQPNLKTFFVDTDCTKAPPKAKAKEALEGAREGAHGAHQVR